MEEVPLRVEGVDLSYNRHIGAVVLGFFMFIFAILYLYVGFDQLPRYTSMSWTTYLSPISIIVDSVYRTPLNLMLMFIPGVVLLVCMASLFSFRMSITRWGYNITLVSSIILVIDSTFSLFVPFQFPILTGPTLFLGATTIIYLYFNLRKEFPVRHEYPERRKKHLAKVARVPEPIPAPVAFRPRGVTVLAAVFLIIGAIGFSIGVGLGFILATMGLTESIKNMTSLIFGLFYIPSGLPASIFFLYAYTFSYIAFQLSVGVYQMQTVGIEILGMIFVFTAIGLFYMKRWGRYLALILGTIMLIGGLIGLIWIFGVIPFTFGLATVLYLKGDVKYEFE